MSGRLDRPRRLVADVSVAVALGMLAGGLHALALAAPSLRLLAWVALVPLLTIAARTSTRGVLAASFAYTGTLLAIDVAPWLIATLARYFAFDPTVATIVGIVAVAVTAAVYAALLAAALILRRRVAPTLGIVWCAALWSVWEPLRTALLPPHFPLSVLATSQVDTLPVLQIASVTGVAGVTALVVATNAALAELWSPVVPRRRAVVRLTLVAVVAVATTIWGTDRLRDTATGAERGPRVVVVDGAAHDAAESTLERYIAATAGAGATPSDLVVWPESALTVDFEANPEAWRRMRAFVDELGIPLLTGGVGSALGDGGLVLQFNSVHFIRPRHGMVSYHKRLLVPFAESWPALLGNPPAAIEPVAAGDTIAVFGDGDQRFGPLICFEITYPAAVRALAARGARFVVSVNNDVWFAGWDAPQAVWARVRAVESGLPVVRATNGGMSAIIDSYGRVLTSGRAQGVPALLTGTVPEPVDTLYVHIGDVFLLLCGVVVLVGVFRYPRRVTE